jgi:CDP-diacylglycerol pyrophosphatase
LKWGKSSTKPTTTCEINNKNNRGHSPLTYIAYIKYANGLLVFKELTHLKYFIIIPLVCKFGIEKGACSNKNK